MPPRQEQYKRRDEYEREKFHTGLFSSQKSNEGINSHKKEHQKRKITHLFARETSTFRPVGRARIAKRSLLCGLPVHSPFLPRLNNHIHQHAGLPCNAYVIYLVRHLARSEY